MNELERPVLAQFNFEIYIRQINRQNHIAIRARKDIGFQKASRLYPA